MGVSLVLILLALFGAPLFAIIAASALLGFASEEVPLDLISNVCETFELSQAEAPFFFRTKCFDGGRVGVWNWFGYHDDRPVRRRRYAWPRA